MTAMALTALAPYRERGEVAEAIEGALQCLSEMQLENGCFASWGSENSESCAQVIVALTALGIDPQKDARFLKNGRSVLDALCDFVLDDGFYHSAELVEVNGMATEQAYYALTAYARFRDGKSRLFDMTGADRGIAEIRNAKAGLPKSLRPSGRGKLQRTTSLKNAVFLDSSNLCRSVRLLTMVPSEKGPDKQRGETSFGSLSPSGCQKTVWLKVSEGRKE